MMAILVMNPIIRRMIPKMIMMAPCPLLGRLVHFCRAALAAGTAFYTLSSSTEKKHRSGLILAPLRLPCGDNQIGIGRRRRRQSRQLADLLLGLAGLTVSLTL